MENLSIFIIIELFYLISNDQGFFDDNWRNYPTCKLGRLQSPIEIKEVESTYSNNFSFVYQSYKDFKDNPIEANDNSYALKTNDIDGGYINFEFGGVIKQYKFIRAEVYPGLHPIDGKKGDYELHLVHEKNLDFITNKNQYRSITDPNIYLVVVLRYKKSTNCIPDKKIFCTSDDGLLENLYKKDSINLGNYPIFQDKRAFFYQGSFIYAPCDENVNYYVVKDFFSTNKDIDGDLSFKILNPSEKYGRPVYKNFKNYKEVLKNNFISVKLLTLFMLILIIF